MESDNQKKILIEWYKILDEDYGDHGDMDSGCRICAEAVELGIIDDYTPEVEE